MSNVLVVYYSRSGNTRRLADAIARAGDCDIEELVDETDRSGFIGYQRCLVDASFRRLTPLAELEHDPAEYDLVVVGTPIWGWSVSAPVRTFLWRYQRRIHEVAFFVTCGGSGGARVLAQMARAVGRAPRGSLVLTEREIVAGAIEAQAPRFIQDLTRRPQEPRPESAPLHIH